MTQWYSIFAGEVKQPGAEFIAQHWGWYTAVFGIVGGFAGGLISDKMFQSRRGPPTAMLCGFVLITATIMAFVLFTQPLVVGWSAVFIVMASIGITSLMSGTAATDFGGRKATATSMGIVNGFAYVGSCIQSFGLGFLVERGGWLWLPVFVIPFAVAGLIISIIIWHDLPEATRRYNSSIEDKDPPLIL
jgi:MFS transporter, OPA family, glycerol-3-phosphate transporter